MNNISLSDDLYQRVQEYAIKNNKKIEDIIHDATMWYLDEEESPVDPNEKRNRRI